jgi:hypothetical protein
MFKLQHFQPDQLRSRVLCLRIMTGLVLALTTPCIASGQGGATNAGKSQPPANAAQTLDTMKGDLRRLVSANEVYRAEKGQYSAQVSALRGFHPSTGVTVTILQASSTGWAAQATAASLPGKSCVIVVGTVPTQPTTLADKRSGAEAVAVCDTP